MAEYSNSELATYRRLTTKCNSRGGLPVDTIIIHHMATKWTAKQCCDYFCTNGMQNSANYCIGYDGSIAQNVDERYSAWTTGSRKADNHSVTIEVSDEQSAPPWSCSAAAVDALVNLCVDICKRNGIKELKWLGDKNVLNDPSKQNVLVHRWFQDTTCPGDWLYNGMWELVYWVNQKLATPKATYDFSFSDVVKGDSGDDVRVMQALLKSYGYGDLKLDGDFGELTLNALKKFQSANGLTVDGWCGQLTWQKLLIRQ